jgi:hypothetical protein
MIYKKTAILRRWQAPRADRGLSLEHVLGRDIRLSKPK